MRKAINCIAGGTAFATFMISVFLFSIDDITPYGLRIVVWLMLICIASVVAFYETMCADD